jgi:dethiobiotin synthetase
VTLVAWRGVVLVTGTDTGVGKTITTAAIAAAATGAGVRVAVLKPAQTGIAPGSGEDGDAETIARLAAPATVRTLASYPDPLAPAAAARTAGQAGLQLDAVLAAVRELATTHDLMLVEGAGGLLVPMGPWEDPNRRGHWTVADLAQRLGAPAVVVVRAGLGTLNHTALTLEALTRRGIDAVAVIGSWPSRPELVHQANLVDLPGELAGLIPAGAGAMRPRAFRVQARSWLAPALHGSLDPMLR